MGARLGIEVRRRGTGVAGAYNQASVCDRQQPAGGAAPTGPRFPEIEQATKVRAKHLKALEDEQFELLPGQTYVKGFLRTYAEYLGLDGQLYVDEFNSRYAIGEEEQPAPIARRNIGSRGRRVDRGGYSSSCSASRR